MNTDKDGTLMIVRECLSRNDEDGIWARINKVREQKSAGFYGDIVVEICKLLEEVSDSDVANRVRSELIPETTKIDRMRKIGRIREEKRLQAEEEDRKMKAEKRKREDEEEARKKEAERMKREEEARIQNAKTYLDSIGECYGQIKREELPAFAQAKKIAIQREAAEKAEIERARLVEQTQIFNCERIKEKKTRITYCFCGRILNDSMDKVCSKCNWIKCPVCASCAPYCS